ncbi:ArsR/SmtB family transcription factor [Jiangella alba]|uniref:DNA-binding transcriptional regulator, ArsR family n=1 Tax=Jiangella alba TaxID=561176 RepID=A0A1H5PWW8_9ACTN|nr:metalloregulator ArsR/SmtB family transcription factor [Jiangella alba]SEF18296.1 DNA-binding transcriptional regulator, ArsR family [Jiangella alba]
MDDDVFRALGDPSRRALLDSLNRDNGQTLRQLCAGLDMARQSVSKHLAVLEAAGLVTTERRGREKHHFLNAEPINAIADRWISRYHRGRVQALADLKTALEATPVSDTQFTYTTFIRTTPEQLWQALTDKAFTSRYWGATFDTDWQAGSPMVWHEAGATIADDEQRVLEADPFRRLSYTWHTFTPEFAAAHGLDPDKVAAMAKEPRSKVTFDLEQRGDLVRLTVIHDGFEPGSQVLQDISGGWPELIASLKTLMETGEPLPSGT